MKIAQIGCGAMGTSMLLNLKKGDRAVSAYNHTYEKAAPLLEQGIRVEYTIQDCVSGADVVCTMVGYPRNAGEIYEGDDDVFVHTKVHTVLIDFTTFSPVLVEELYTAAKAKEYAMLDVPVSSGDSGARAASLSTMTDGDEEVFEQIRPLFSLLGTGIQYTGEAGSGQHTKACNQIAVAGAVAAVSGTLVYTRVTGLDKQKMLTATTKGAAGSWRVDGIALRVPANDFTSGFCIKHFTEDMHIVQQEMEQQDVHLNMLEAVCNTYEALADMEEENNGTQALVHYYK